MRFFCIWDIMCLDCFYFTRKKNSFYIPLWKEICLWVRENSMNYKVCIRQGKICLEYLDFVRRNSVQSGHSLILIYICMNMWVYVSISYNKIKFYLFCDVDHKYMWYITNICDTYYVSYDTYHKCLWYIIWYI